MTIALWVVGGAAVFVALVALSMRWGHAKPVIHDTAGKVMLVTGANSGVGLATAIALARGGGTVVITTRSEEKADRAVARIRDASGNDDVHSVLLDLSSLDSVRRAAAGVLERFNRLDVLVNNAGAVNSRRLLTDDGFEMSMGANHLGPFLFTELLTPLLVRSAPARIVNVSSNAHAVADLRLDDLSWEQRPYAQMAAYGASKLANILHANELARRLADQGVTANSAHPGAIGSSFGTGSGTSRGWRIVFRLGRPFMATPDHGAATPVKLAVDPETAGVTGQYWSRSRPRTTSEEARDVELARALWDRSAELVGLS